MSTSILILGVNGFVGSALVEKILRDTDWEIYGLDLTHHKIQDWLDHPRLHFTQGDMCQNMEWIEQQVQHCDVILPLVAVANPSVYVSDPLFVYQLDYEANLKVVKMCVAHQKHLIFPSTSEVYGMSPDIPFDEETSNLVTGPISKHRWIYSCAKQMLDRVIHAYGLQEGLNYTLFRPFNWIGPKQDELHASERGSARVVMQFVSNIMDGKDLYLVDGGTQRRCFTYIDDGIEALIKIIQQRHTNANRQIFNIGNPMNEYSIKELAYLVKESMQRYDQYADKAHATNIIPMPSNDYYGEGYQDVIRRVPSIDRAKQALNWHPNVPLKSALTQILDYHFNH